MHFMCHLDANREKTDVFSFGIVVWEIYTFGITPYSMLTNDQASAKGVCRRRHMGS